MQASPEVLETVLSRASQGFADRKSMKKRMRKAIEEGRKTGEVAHSEQPAAASVEPSLEMEEGM